MDKKWYMITTISGKEEKVIEALKNKASADEVSELEDFKVMTVPHLSPRELERKLNGETFKVRTKNLFPGYIFIKMDMSNDAWFLVRNTLYVTGLVGSSGSRTKPTPVSNLEMRKMAKRVETITNDFNEGKFKTQFLEGLMVEVQGGPMKGQLGTIIETNDAKSTSIIEIILFDKKTPTEIEHKFLKIKK